MFLSGSGGAILFAYLWSMLDVEPGRSEMLDNTTDPGDTSLKRTRHGPSAIPAQGHKRAESEMSEPDSETHDDGLKSGKRLNSNSMRMHST